MTKMFNAGLGAVLDLAEFEKALDLSAWQASDYYARITSASLSRISTNMIYAIERDMLTRRMGLFRWSVRKMEG